MSQSIPMYFQKAEPPIIFTNIINHSEILKLVSDLDIHAITPKY